MMVVCMLTAFLAVAAISLRSTEVPLQMRTGNDRYSSKIALETVPQMFLRSVKGVSRLRASDAVNEWKQRFRSRDEGN